MIKDVTFGQYIHKNSLIHNLDARLKLFLILMFIVFIFVAGNAYSLGFISVIVLLILIASKIPVKTYLKNIRIIIPIIIFTSLINAFYSDGGTLLVSFWIFKIYTSGIYRAIFMTVRITALILISSVLSYTSTPTNLTDAIESLLKPLNYIGLQNAVHTMAMMMTIAIRFIPTLIEETDKIMSSQKARGASMESGGLIKRVKALLPILIPLLISAMRRSYELAEAMESRCYNGAKGRVRMKVMHLKKRDYFCLVASLLIFTATVTLNIII